MTLRLLAQPNRLNLVLLPFLALSLSRGAVAQVRHGFAGGDRILYDAAFPADIVLTAGSGFVDGVAYQNATTSIAPALVGNAVSYCYVLNGAAGAGFNPAAFGLTCPSPAVPPTSDGHPSVAIGGSLHALFVGSFLTNASSIIPFYRNGEQVILTPQNTEGAGAIDPGVELLNRDIGWGSWATVGVPVSPLPSSASQVILDVFLNTPEKIAHNLCVLDPNQVPAAGNPVTTCQGQQMVNADPFPGLSNTYANYRIAANRDANGNVWFGADGALQAFGTLLYFVVVYRGYVEPVNHLLPR